MIELEVVVRKLSEKVAGMDKLLKEKGTLIVIEGLDGSGKSTQVPMVLPALEKNGIKGTKISFPDYESQSSALVKMYLGGELGTDASDINAYAASSFYAVDRFASYQTKWKSLYENGGLIIAERYSSSNQIYQLSKLPESEWDSYLAWADDFEHNKLQLPRPDLVVFLRMPLDISQMLMTGRYQSTGGEKDIHEKNLRFLQECSASADYAGTKQGWKFIECAKDGKPLSIEEIHEKIMTEIINKIKGGGRG